MCICVLGLVSLCRHMHVCLCVHRKGGAQVKEKGNFCSGSGTSMGQQHSTANRVCSWGNTYASQ